MGRSRAVAWQAGKTTFAKALEVKTGAVRITKDEWSIRLIGNDPTVEGYAEHDHNVIELSRDVAFQLVEKGSDVIIDEGFWEKEQRRALRKRIEGMGAKAVIYYLDTPLDIIWERLIRRNCNFTKDAFVISRDLFEYYLQFWQPPGEDEEYTLASEIHDDIDP